MGKPLKLLVGGVILGIMAVLAIVGAKSLLDDRQSGNPMPVTVADEQAVLPDLQSDVQVDALADQPDPADQGVISIEASAPEPAVHSPEQQTGQTAVTAAVSASEPAIELVDEQGALQVALVDPNDPVRTPNAYIVVRDEQGKQVASKGNTRTATFDLPEGKYRVLASVRGKQVQRMVAIYAGETSDVLLELALAPQAPSQQAPSSPAKPAPAAPVVTQQTPAQPVAGASGRLDARILEADTRRPVKANIYVQKPNGEHVANKTYVDSALITLPVGTYTVTVKAKEKRDLIRTVRILKNKGLRQDFVLLSAQQSQPDKPVKPAPADKTGILRLHAVSGIDGSPFPVNFRVTTRDGQVLHRIRRSAFAEVTVPSSVVIVHIRYKKMRGKERIRIKPGKKTDYTFTIRPNETGQLQKPSAPVTQAPPLQPQSPPPASGIEDSLRDFLNRL